ATFLWTVASLDLCPLQVGDPLGWSLQPCARFTGGRLGISSSGRASGSSDQYAVWIDVEGLLRGHWQLGPSAFAEAEAGAFAPVRRFDLSFQDPPGYGYRTPSVALRFAAGVGWVFR